MEYKCEYCNKVYKSKSGLTKHINTKHSDNEQLEPTEQPRTKQIDNNLPIFEVTEVKDLTIVFETTEPEPEVIVIPEQHQQLIDYFKLRNKDSFEATKVQIKLLYNAYTDIYKKTLSTGCKYQMMGAYSQLYKYIKKLYPECEI
jgi:hypothetical protein